MTISPLSPEQTQESIQRFEQQAGLRDAGYTPHKGLTTEETKYLRVAEALHVSLFPRTEHTPNPHHLWLSLAEVPKLPAQLVGG